MWYELDQFFHNTLGVCFWVIPTLIVVAVMVIIGLIHWRNQKKREKDFEKELEETLWQETSAAPSE